MKTRLTLARSLVYAGAYWIAISLVGLSIHAVNEMLEDRQSVYFVGLCGLVLMLAGLLIGIRKGGR